MTQRRNCVSTAAAELHRSISLRFNHDMPLPADLQQKGSHILNRNFRKIRFEWRSVKRKGIFFCKTAWALFQKRHTEKFRHSQYLQIIPEKKITPLGLPYELRHIYRSWYRQKPIPLTKRRPQDQFHESILRSSRVTSKHYTGQKIATR